MVYKLKINKVINYKINYKVQKLFKLKLFYYNVLLDGNFQYNVYGNFGRI